MIKHITVVEWRDNTNFRRKIKDSIGMELEQEQYYPYVYFYEGQKELFKSLEPVEGKIYTHDTFITKFRTMEERGEGYAAMVNSAENQEDLERKFEKELNELTQMVFRRLHEI